MQTALHTHTLTHTGKHTHSHKCTPHIGEYAFNVHTWRVAAFALLPKKPQTEFRIELPFSRAAFMPGLKRINATAIVEIYNSFVRCVGLHCCRGEAYCDLSFGALST